MQKCFRKMYNIRDCERLQRDLNNYQVKSSLEVKHFIFTRNVTAFLINFIVLNFKYFHLQEILILLYLGYSVL